MTLEAGSASVNPYRLTIEEIRKFLPHRAPFLLVDRVLEIHPQGQLDRVEANEDKVGTRVVAIKNVSFNEPQFMGHFPDYSIYPGVYTIEAMAQVATFAFYPYAKAVSGALERGFKVVLLGVDGARFKKPVTPGDQLRIECTMTKSRRSLLSFSCVATVDGQKVAEADLLANLTMNE